MDAEKAIRDYIKPLLHMSLATAEGSVPWVCEVYFAYDAELHLYFRSLKTRRHSLEIASSPRVAGSIVRQHAPRDEVVGVYFEGTAVMLGPGTEQRKACGLITERLRLDGDILEEAKHADGHQFYKINVANWYIFGRFGAPKGQKLKLKWS